VIDQVLGNRYRITKQLGAGGMAWVYLAEDLREDRPVAVKVLYPQFAQDPTYTQRFNREAKIALDLVDEHLVSVLDYGADRDTQYLVMEYVEGEPLHDYLLSRGALPWREAVGIALQVSRALEVADRLNIVHRDIKPQNLMRSDDGAIRVLDFGLARVVDLPSLTGSAFLGSPSHVSPEQATGKKIDIRSDIYSLGVVLYQMLAGRPPFEAENAWSVIGQHIASPPPSLRATAPDMPFAVERVVNCMLAKEPDERYQTPRELSIELQRLLEDNELVEKQPEEQAAAEVSLPELRQGADKAIDEERWTDAVATLSQILEREPDDLSVRRELEHASEQASLAAMHASAHETASPVEVEDGISDQSPDPLDAEADLPETEPDQAIPISTQMNEDSPPADEKPALDTVEPAAAMPAVSSKRSWRKWLLTAVLVIGLLAAGAWGYQQIRSQRALDHAYLEASQAIEAREWDSAAEHLDWILARSPNYRDTQELRERIQAVQDATDQFNRGMSYYQDERWVDAIALWKPLLELEGDWDKEALKQQICTAYRRQGLRPPEGEELGSPSQQLKRWELINEWYAEAADLCPDDIVLSRDRHLAGIYLEALQAWEQRDWDTAIDRLIKISDLRPLYLKTILPEQLYQAFIQRGQGRLKEGDSAGAEEDFRNALEVAVKDRTAAQEALDMLLDVERPRPKYPNPDLVSPADEENIGGGEGAVFYLEWEAVPNLAEDEFYNITIMHFENGVPTYWGDGVREPRQRIDRVVGKFMGFGKADHGEFFWWVIVQRDADPNDGRMDGPDISPESEHRKFTWQ